MTHLAAAIGVPTAAIFMTTDPQVWQPLGNHVAVIEPFDRKQPEKMMTLGHVKAILSRLLIGCYSGDSDY